SSFPFCLFFFFSNATSPTVIYTLSLHDALPICEGAVRNHHFGSVAVAEQARRGVIDPDHVIRHAADLDAPRDGVAYDVVGVYDRSEEHTSELQSRGHLVCRLLLEKKKKITEQYR